MSRFQYNSRFRAMYQVCYPFFLEKHTDFLSGQMRLAVRPWLLEWQKQNNITYFKNVRKSIGRIMLSNMVQTSQQHCCMTAAGMLQVYKVVALASQQALIPRCVGLYLEYKQTVLRRREFVCMLRIKHRTLHLKVSLFTFLIKESSTLPQNMFKNVYNKTGSCIASVLMSGDVLVMKQYITFI